MSASDQHPLKNVVLCSTSLTQDARTQLAEVGTQMGAIHKLDLTSDVTHLVVGDIRTPKYRYVAKERPDVKVLHQDWIQAMRQAWMDGDEIDVKALEEEYRLPTFSGLRICVTGFDNLQERNRLHTVVEAEGAEYHGDLTRQITHLVVAVPQGAKYNAAKSWGVSTVSLKWFEDSIQRGMALDESLYDPVLPWEEQGKGAVRTESRPQPNFAKRARDDSQSLDEAGRRKFRRSASSRLETHSQDLWQDISARETAREPSKRDQWQEATNRADGTISEHKPSESLDESNVLTTDEPKAEDGSIFSGWHVLIYGFDPRKTGLLQQFLEPNGARVVRTTKDLEDVSAQPLFKQRCLLIPQAMPEQTKGLPDVPSGTVTATEWWVERCLHRKQLIDPSSDVLCQPLGDVKIPEFQGLTISTSGFTGIDLLHASRAVKLAGAIYEEMLIPSVSVMISGADTIRKEKAFYAAKHSIPVVRSDWLWTCLKNRKWVETKDFSVQLPASETTDITGRSSTRSPTGSSKGLTCQGNSSNRTNSRPPTRLSNTRKRQASNSLLLQPAKPSAGTTRSPFIHVDSDDEEDAPVADDREPSATRQDATVADHQRALQPLSPNSSPRKINPSIGASLETKDKASTVNTLPDLSEPSITSLQPGEPSQPIEPIQEMNTNRAASERPPARPQEELNADIASLLQRHKTSRTPACSSELDNRRRKPRTLGRASSGVSLNRAVSLTAEEPLASMSGDDNLADGLVDGFAVEKRDEPKPPSTQLGYETAEAEAQRLKSGRVMTVKDVGTHTSAVGGRVRTRQRAAR